jgi:hypothetical protein
MFTLIVSVVAAVIIIWVLAYYGASALIWSLFAGAALLALTAGGAIGGIGAAQIWIAVAALRSRPSASAL